MSFPLFEKLNDIWYQRVKEFKEKLSYFLIVFLELQYVFL